MKNKIILSLMLSCFCSIIISQETDSTKKVGKDTTTPCCFKLYQVEPEVVTCSPRFRFNIPETTKVMFYFYNENMTQIDSIDWKECMPAKYIFNINNNLFDSLKDGIYYYRIVAVNFQDTKTFTIKRDCDKKTSKIPCCFNLSICYPQPLGCSKFYYSVPKKTYVQIAFYDVMGAKIYSVYSGDCEPGEYSYDYGNWAVNVKNGVYFCKMTARQNGSSTNDFEDTKKFIIVK